MGMEFVPPFFLRDVHYLAYGVIIQKDKIIVKNLCTMEKNVQGVWHV